MYTIEKLADDYEIPKYKAEEVVSLAKLALWEYLPDESGWENLTFKQRSCREWFENLEDVINYMIREDVKVLEEAYEDDLISSDTYYEILDEMEQAERDEAEELKFREYWEEI